MQLKNRRDGRGKQYSCTQQSKPHTDRSRSHVHCSHMLTSTPCFSVLDTTVVCQFQMEVVKGNECSSLAWIICSSSLSVAAELLGILWGGELVLDVFSS